MAFLWRGFDCRWMKLATLVSSLDLCIGVGTLALRLILVNLHPSLGSLGVSCNLRNALASALAAQGPASSSSSTPHLVVEGSDLGTGQHATAFRVYLSNSICLGASQDQSKRSAVLKVWRPASIREAITWGMAALEFRLEKILQLPFKSIAYSGSDQSYNERPCYNSDYKAGLSRPAQYLASFEVESSLYRATRGLGSGSSRLGSKAGAPNALWLASGITHGAGWCSVLWAIGKWLPPWLSQFTNFLNSQSGGHFPELSCRNPRLGCSGFASIMLLEDVCSNTDMGGVDRRQDGGSGSASHENTGRVLGSWHAAEGFRLAEAKACLNQAAKLHATFWGIGSSRGPCNSCNKVNGKVNMAFGNGSACGQGGGSTTKVPVVGDREDAVVDARQRLGMCEHDELWAEGGYWVGEKRPLPGAYSGDKRRNGRSNNDKKRKSKATALAVQDAWTAIVNLHKSRWCPAFIDWATAVQPGQVLACSLEYCSSKEDGCKDCGSKFSNAHNRTAASHIQHAHNASQTTPLEAELASLRPLTIVHGDFKVNNIYLQTSSSTVCSYTTDSDVLGSVEPSDAIPREKLGASDLEDEPKRWRAHIIDWQWCGVGVGALDVAHFLCTSLHFNEVLTQPDAVGLLVATYRDGLASYVAEEVITRQLSRNCMDETDEMCCTTDCDRADIDTPGSKKFLKDADDLNADASQSWPSVPSLEEIQRQVALHIVRYTLDALLYKWPNAPPSEMDANNGNCAKHGLDRRSYDHMQACIVLGVNAACWLRGNDLCNACKLSHQSQKNRDCAELGAKSHFSWPWQRGNTLF